MKARRILVIGIFASLALFTGMGGAQTVVVGTGNPDIDIAAVQAAVDRGGSILLRGHFSFNNPPTKHGALPDLMAMVLVSKESIISGTWNEHGEVTAIDGGEIPFAVEAGGAAVRIERLRFIRPKRYAIFVDAVTGLAIDSCIIESVEPLPFSGNATGMSYGFGISVSTLLGLPTPESPGKPENISGKLSIADNQISLNSAADEGMGIMIVSVGDLERPVDLDISANTISNASQKAINLKQIGGRARIERNLITSSVVYTGPARGFIAGIHCGGSGSYLVAHNRIDMADPNGAGIRLRAYPGLGSAIESATVADNDVTMSAEEDAVLGARSAGVEILGLARDNTVHQNRIRGHARIALSLAPDNTGIPTRNSLYENDHEGFISSAANRGQQK